MLSETGSPYANDLGVKWEPGEGDVSRVSLPFEEKNTMGGGLHGGAIASLVPLSTLGPRGGAVASGSTVSMHVCYVRAARKGVVARTRAVRRVRELSFFDTLVEGEDGSSIAYASSVVSESSRGSWSRSRPGAAHRGRRRRSRRCGAPCAPRWRRALSQASAAPDPQERAGVRRARPERRGVQSRGRRDDSRGSRPHAHRRGRGDLPVDGRLVVAPRLGRNDRVGA